MNEINYEYGSTPRKLEPSYKPDKTAKSNYKKQLKINEEQKKEALKIEKKIHHKNIAYVLAIFAILFTISYRSLIINEKFTELQTSKEKLASIEKTNGQLEVSIESSLNLSNIEQSAKEKLGMQKLDNNQKVYVTLEKKDYVESSVKKEDIKNTSSDKWYQKIINKVFKK